MLKDEEYYDEANYSLEACRYFHGFYQIFHHFILVIKIIGSCGDRHPIK